MLKNCVSFWWDRARPAKVQPDPQGVRSKTGPRILSSGHVLHRRAHARKRQGTAPLLYGHAYQTIQLAATSQGWDCCIIQTFDHDAAPELLGVPEGMKNALVLSLGVVKETQKE